MALSLRLCRRVQTVSVSPSSFASRKGVRMPRRFPAVPFFPLCLAIRGRGSTARARELTHHALLIIVSTNPPQLPKAWRGVRDEDLSGLTGIPGCVFVHAAGFIGGNKTLEGAKEMAARGLTEE